MDTGLERKSCKSRASVCSRIPPSSRPGSFIFQCHHHPLELRISKDQQLHHYQCSNDLPALTASFSSTTLLKIKRIYLEGAGVLGPSLPSKCRIFVARTVCSQSSMNSQRWARPASLASGFSSTMLMMQSTMARLYSKPPWQKRRLPFVLRMLFGEMLILQGLCL